MKNSYMALLLTLCLVFCFGLHINAEYVDSSPFNWMKKDNFDDVMWRMNEVNIENCASKSTEELYLPMGTVSQLPAFNTIPINNWYDNRTLLLHMHNLAYGRGHFFSYILQRLNTSKVDFPLLPGFLYYYLSTSADVSSGPAAINGSSVLYIRNYSYPNWLTDLDFNKTIPLFGPRARRLDDWMDENNWLREPTNHTIQVNDIGAGPNRNYTAEWYRTNPYFTDTQFLSDVYTDYTTKNKFDTGITFANIYGDQDGPMYSRRYFGPTAPGVKETNIPVVFSRPYFDCGKSNKWIVTATAPVVDYMYRYSEWLHLRGGLIVAAITMDIDFLRIDFNPCPASLGNDPHYFAGVARCKPTTMCEPLPGFGYRRGGYQCHCRPGYRLPYNQNAPFQGVDIEQATAEEYNNNFDCLKVQWQQHTIIDGTLKENLERRRRSTDGNLGVFSKYLRPILPKSLMNSIDHTAGKIRGAIGHVKEGVKSKIRTIRSVISQFQPSSSSSSQFPRLTSKHEAPQQHRDLDEAMEREQQESEQNTQKRQESSASNKNAPRHPLYRHILGDNGETSSTSSSEKSLNRQRRELHYEGKLSAFDYEHFMRIDSVLEKFQNVTKDNCHLKRPDELTFPGEVGYGADKRFVSQARMALRLAHFLSAYYQNFLSDEIYGNVRVNQPLNRHHLFGEVISNVASDFYIHGSGIFFDNHMYQEENGTLWKRFAPFAYKVEGSSQTWNALDMSLKKYRDYVNSDWFIHLKERWASNTYGMDRFVIKPWKRKDHNGTMEEKFDKYPLYYRAPRVEDGYWTQPYFECKLPLKNWFMTYAVPFFGLPPESQTLIFMGVVTVNVQLYDLDINQCPASFYTPNFFKNTARCDYRTSYCVPWSRRKFTRGNYRCECRQGFEFPLKIANWYYEGQTMESEYIKKLNGELNKYDTLRCREAAAPRSVSPPLSALYLTFLVFLSLFIAH